MLLAGYLVALAVVAAGVFVAVGVLLSATWAVLLAIVVVLALFVRYVLARRTKAAGSQDVWINRKRHPELWRLVDELAGIAEVRTPDELRIGPEMGVELREQSRFRCLVIGLPTLAALSADELRAAVAHELAHAYRLPTLPRVLLWPYLLLTKSQRREHDAAAKKIAAEAASAETVEAVFDKLPKLEVAWQQFRRSAAEVTYQFRTPDLVQRFNAGTELAADEPAWQLLTDPDRTLTPLQRQLYEELGPESAESESAESTSVDSSADSESP